MKWTESTLGEIVADNRGLVQTGPFGAQLHQSDYTEEGIPVIMPTDITDGRISTERIALVSDQTVNRLTRHKIKPRTIVLPRRGEITKRAFIRDDQAGWLCGSGCLKIEVHETDLLPEFLYYYMSLPAIGRWLEQHAVGSTMLNLSAGIVNMMPVRYPKWSTQEKIADILTAYDDLMENNRRRVALLEESARQLYREWFVRLCYPGHECAGHKKGLPAGWSQQTLGDLCIDLRETVSPDELDPETPYIGLEHMPRRSISLTDWGTADAVTSTKLRYQTGDILFGKIRPYFHKVGIAFTNGVVSSDALVIRPNTDALRSYVLMLVSSDEFVASTAQSMREGSKMPRADWKQMVQYPANVPPAPLLADFEERVEAITTQLRNLCFQNQKLRAARDHLLPRLLSGDLAV